MPEDYTAPRDRGAMTYRYTRQARFTAVRGDQNSGFPRYRSTEFVVTVVFAYPHLIDPNGTGAFIPGETYSNETVDDWLRDYVADRDLNDTPNPFPSNGGEIADRLLSSLSGNVDTIESVTVRMSDRPGESWTARYRWSRS